MKNAILTFHSVPNFGAFLQTYALYKSILNITDEVEIIDYEPNFIKENYNPYRIDYSDFFKSSIKILLYSRDKKKKIMIFKEFLQKHLTLSSKKVSTKEELKKLCQQYPIIICGSDQIWNSEITNYDNSYFLPFNLDNTKKCSYAASFGNENINYQSECLTYLKDFKYISVREKQSAEKINSVCSFNAKTHVDPTLLLRKDEWNQLASNRVVDKPYLLIYVVKQPKELIDYAINFAKKNNLEIIQLSDIKKRREIKYVKNVNPSEFLMYFRDASYIFTNSFHGTVFSIIFQKEYFIELISLDGSTNTRSQSLLKELDLEVSSINKKINWSEIEKRVANQREESINYLKEINNRF